VRLIAALKPRPPFGVLLVTDRDRIGREQVEVSYLLKQIIAAGVRVFECQGAGREITLGSAVDKLILAVENFAAEVEREKVRTRTYAAMAHRARAGRSTGAGHLRLRQPSRSWGGWLRSHVERAVEPREAAVVERIFRLAADGWGVKRIAGTLNVEAALAPMPRRAGRPRGWAPSSVREILGREVYRGTLTWNKSRKRDGWGQKRQRPREVAEWLHVPAPALRIVSDELWQAAHAQLDGRRAVYLAQNGGRAFGRPASGVESPYLLTGVGTCAACGGSMAVLKRAHGPRGQRRQVPFYGCMTRHLRGDAVCGNILEVRLADADKAVLTAVEHDVLRVEVLETSLYKAMEAGRQPTNGHEAQGAELRAELARLETEVTRLATAIAAGGDLPALVAAMQARERRHAYLRAELAALERQASMRRDIGNVAHTLDVMRAALTDWQGMLRQEPPEARHTLRALLAGRLVFTPTTGFYTFEGPGTITPRARRCRRRVCKGCGVPDGTRQVVAQALTVPVHGLAHVA
jgi:site-specific DNA recombinase